ncbi:MAG: glycerol-3-phosphate 1-O-acyltransferase PlsY [Oscillospiraceae bacterium]|nr:glycerol-3-phosphate 1-O-acyltransferase PlsY [Oscillospiraceae bacterium]
MKLTLYLLAIALSSYLLGSINGAIITSKYIYKKDVRQFGSGNPGLTNFYRVFGVKGAALVLAIDILKSVIPAIFGGWLLGKLGMRTLGAEAAAFFVMVGHSFPAYYKFRGGKTVLAAGAALFVIDLRVAIASWVVFLCVMLLTRFVSLGSMAAGVAYPVSAAIFGLGPWCILIAALSAALLLFRHKANIQRLVNGTESRISFSRRGGEK